MGYILGEGWDRFKKYDGSVWDGKVGKHDLCECTGVNENFLTGFCPEGFFS